MSWLRSATGRSVIGICAATGIMVAAVMVMARAGVHPPLAVRLAIALAAAIPILWFACNYWRSLDEAAREAQKWGWFWGGSFGLGAGFIFVALWSKGLAGLTPPSGDPGMILFTGGMVVMMAQLACFLIAWAYWWWRRR